MGALHRIGASIEVKCRFSYKYMHLLGHKDPDAGKDGRQEEKAMTEDEMVAWHHLLDAHEFE